MQLLLSYYLYVLFIFNEVDALFYQLNSKLRHSKILFTANIPQLLETCCLTNWHSTELTMQNSSTVNSRLKKAIFPFLNRELPYARHYKPRLVFFFYPIFTLPEAYIADNLCTKNGNSSFFKLKIRGL